MQIQEPQSSTKSATLHKTVPMARNSRGQHFVLLKNSFFEKNPSTRRIELFHNMCVHNSVAQGLIFLYKRDRAVRNIMKKNAIQCDYMKVLIELMQENDDDTRNKTWLNFILSKLKVIIKRGDMANEVTTVAQLTMNRHISIQTSAASFPVLTVLPHNNLSNMVLSIVNVLNENSNNIILHDLLFISPSDRVMRIEEIEQRFYFNNEHYRLKLVVSYEGNKTVAGGEIKTGHYESYVFEEPFNRWWHLDDREETESIKPTATEEILTISFLAYVKESKYLLLQNDMTFVDSRNGYKRRFFHMCAHNSVAHGFIFAYKTNADCRRYMCQAAKHSKYFQRLFDIMKQNSNTQRKDIWGNFIRSKIKPVGQERDMHGSAIDLLERTLSNHTSFKVGDKPCKIISVSKRSNTFKFPNSLMQTVNFKKLICHELLLISPLSVTVSLEAIPKAFIHDDEVFRLIFVVEFDGIPGEPNPSNHYLTYGYDNVHNRWWILDDMEASEEVFLGTKQMNVELLMYVKTVPRDFKITLAVSELESDESDSEVQ